MLPSNHNIQHRRNHRSQENTGLRLYLIKCTERIMLLPSPTIIPSPTINQCVHAQIATKA